MSKSNYKTAKDVPVPKLPKVNCNGISKIDLSGLYDIRNTNTPSEDKPKMLTAIKNTIIFQTGVFLLFGLLIHFFKFPEELEDFIFVSGMVLALFFISSILAFIPIANLIIL